MGDTFFLKVGDTLPDIQAELTNDGGNPVNLDGVIPTLRLYQPRCHDLYLERQAQVFDEEGIVEYEWEDGDIEDSGRYRLEFHLEYPDGQTESFPSDDYHDLVITQ